VALTELTGYERPRRLSSRTRLTAVAVSGTLAFDELPGGTHMGWDWQLEPLGLTKAARPLLALLGRRQERDTWESLERYLEGRPRDPAGAG
jgi:hypothetical protein